MKQEDTKQRILEKSLELFASKGYDAVSVGEIAKAVGVKAPSLYNHFASKQAIFDAIVESTAAHYEKDTGEISIHVQDVKQDFALFAHISEDALVEKVRQIFFYSLHDHTVSQFRQMMTLEQFRSPGLAELYSQRYVDRMIDYHADIFRTLISLGILRAEDPDTLALQVIDCDMCDEIRTVYSLSGGESFLISLALALGLSSLSSNNLKVESLFIDEGFGSLDAESLRTAMEALEQLQMQGRKIGVISHVQEMSERISVQVQVHKKVNGKSVLTVVG